MMDVRNDRQGRLAAACLGLLLMVLAGPGVGRAADGGLAAHVAAAWSRDGYRPLTAAASKPVEDLFAAILAGAPSAAGMADRLDMELVPAAGGLQLLREPDSARYGRGVYAFRQDGDPVPVLLQAPHARSDRHTGALSALLMEAHALRALAVNTAPRRISPDSDLAHQAESWMMALTRAFARAYPDAAIIQLHGFAVAKRSTPAGRDAAYIVSPGHLDDSLTATGFAQCLRAGVDGPVRLYPHDVTELGGTTNSMARWLRGAGHMGFVHVEIADGPRAALRAGAAARREFGACLEHGW